MEDRLIAVPKNLILFGILIFLTQFFLSSCYEFESINQPEFADPNSIFEVPITITLTPEEEGGTALFGICLPLGWKVTDGISYSGVLSGTFRYSKEWSDSMESYDSAPEGYYWWVSISDSVNTLPEGEVMLTPNIQTDYQIGTFFIDYMLTDRFDDHYIITSNHYPISVGVPPTIETITNTNDNGEGSLRQAMETLGSGSTILFDLPYPATVVLDSQLLIDRSLSIRGPSSGELTISGNGQDRVIYVEGHVSVNLSNLSVINGNTSEDGGGIYCESANLYLSNMYIYSNKASQGGGIFIEDAESRLEDVTLGNNIALYGDCGGIFILSRGSLSLVNTIVWGNSPRQIWGDPTSITVAHSDIQYGLAGMEFSEDVVNWLEGNMNIYPMFVDAFSNNYGLQAGSPCIDAGIQDTFFVYNDGRDTLFIPPMDYIGTAPDIGAHEFGSPLAIEDDIRTPETYLLRQNYPNPFNSVTTIEFNLPKSSQVSLKILNPLGEEIAVLVSEKLMAGKYKYDWDASEVASGIYLYLLTARRVSASESTEFQQMRKMVYIK
jgi:hypothetical protein